MGWLANFDTTLLMRYLADRFFLSSEVYYYESATVFFSPSKQASLTISRAFPRQTTLARARRPCPATTQQQHHRV
jgi:hypothetical protein